MKTQRTKLVAAFAVLMMAATASLFADGKWFVGKTLHYDDRGGYKTSIRLYDNGSVVFTHNYGVGTLRGSYTINEAEKTITCKYHEVDGDGGNGCICIYRYVLARKGDKCDVAGYAGYDLFLSDSVKFDAKSAKFLFGKKFDFEGNILEFSNDGKVLYNGGKMCSYAIDESAKYIVGYTTSKGEEPLPPYPTK